MADVPDPSRGNLFCPHCDYSLQGTVANACPECGEPFDLEELSRSRIPWVYRSQIGRVRAYLRTVSMVILHLRRFCQEVGKPVNYAHARRFWWVTAGLVFVVACIAAGILIHELNHRMADELLEKIWVVILIPICLLLFVTGTTGLHTYWFHPRSVGADRQNRATALAYYGCAPLALLPLFLVPLIVNDESPMFKWMAVALTVLVGATWWAVMIYMVRRVALRSVAATLIFAVVHPLCCVLLAVLIFAGIPALVGYVVLILTNWPPA